MTFDEYQKKAATFDLLGDGSGQGLAVGDPAYIAKVLGLVGETGEIAEKYKKIIRDKQGKITEADKAEITKELGDVLWYLALLANYLGVPLQDVAELNIDKLSSRKDRGTQHGSGDNR